jgi:ankyrin repeat protein
MAESIRDWCLSCNVEALEKVVAQSPESLWRPDDDGRHALHWACVSANDSILPMFLRLPGAIEHINDGDESRWTPLLIAASGGKAGAVQLLLVSGASANARTESGQIPLHYHKARASAIECALIYSS